MTQPTKPPVDKITKLLGKPVTLVLDPRVPIETLLPGAGEATTILTGVDFSGLCVRSNDRLIYLPWRSIIAIQGNDSISSSPADTVNDYSVVSE